MHDKCMHKAMWVHVAQSRDRISFIMNKECNYINKTTNNNEKSPCGPGPTGQCMVHACPHQGTGPTRHTCCVHDEGNGGGTVG